MSRIARALLVSLAPTSNVEPGQPGSRGKLSVTFRVGPDGRIREWSASGKNKDEG